MNYTQTLDYLYHKLPMFTRIGDAALKKDLYNIKALCDHLDHPENKFKTIHIGGTNGKGSTSHMLAAIFQKAGYKTGLYTSPHLKDFRERIRINGKMISKGFVTDFIQQEKLSIENIDPSFFEVTVAMAFSWFAAQEVDIAIIEVGLGGRLDSTNIITPQLSVITNISLDHTHILGDNLKAIAFEKAGIIKPGIPVVIGEKQPETEEVFRDKASTTHSNITFADQELHSENTYREQQYLYTSIFRNSDCLYKNIRLDLTGTYQLKNILTVVQSVSILKNLGYNLPDKAIFSALKAVGKITGLQGRWQTLGKAPLIICDTGHNIAGITEVLSNIQQTPHQNLHIVLGMVKDKDISGILALLPKNACYYFSQPDLERALPASELAEKAKQHHLNGQVTATIPQALHLAKSKAQANDLIFVGGSTFVVAEVL